MLRSVRHALVPVLLVAPFATPAGAVTTPSKVALGSCYIDVTSGIAECLVVLEPNPAGEWGQTTYSGYGAADLDCQVNGSHHIEGDYGFEWHPFPHGADVCTLLINASEGHSDAYVQ